jgi:hypothetical protein
VGGLQTPMGIQGGCDRLLWVSNCTMPLAQWC